MSHSPDGEGASHCHHSSTHAPFSRRPTGCAALLPASFHPRKRRRTLPPPSLHGAPPDVVPQPFTPPPLARALAQRKRHETERRAHDEGKDAENDEDEDADEGQEVLGNVNDEQDDLGDEEIMDDEILDDEGFAEL